MAALEVSGKSGRFGGISVIACSISAGMEFGAGEGNWHGSGQQHSGIGMV